LFLACSQILGSGMSAKMWEVAIEHARTCVLDERVYVYYSPSSPHTNGVVFNVVGQAMGLYSESEYVPIDKLSETEKVYFLSILECFSICPFPINARIIHVTWTLYFMILSQLPLSKTQTL